MKSSGFLYQKVYEEIKEDIRNGVLAKGAKIPSEKKLSAKYGFSTITIKTALGILAEEGYIKRVPGKGTFVTGQGDVQDQVRNMQVSDNRKNYPTIGVVFEHVASPFGLDMMYHMDRMAMEKGYRLCIRFSYTDQEKETEEIDFLLSLGVCGLIIMPSHGEHYNTKILKLVIDHFPVVLIDKNLDGIPVPAVFTDNAACVSMLVDHLIERGYRNIAMVTSRSNSVSSIKERRKGFYNRLTEKGMKIYDECIVEMKLDSICGTGRQTAEQNIETISKYLDRNPSIDSLVCLEYGFLSDIFEACRRNGKRIPEDIAVCSIDEDSSYPAGYLFTHVKQDEEAIAKKAIELIIDMINGKNDNKIMDYKIPGTFHEGRTTTKKKK